MIYRFLFRALLSRLPAEPVHRLSFGLLRVLLAMPGARVLTRRFCRSDDPRLRVHALGMTFPNPVGLAAGFDKDARGPDALAALGFGFVEIGTVTAQPQPGNARPRLFRLPEDHALVNRMGFNNAGSKVVAGRLGHMLNRIDVPLGVNIGKTKLVSASRAADDYVDSTLRLARHADYLVVNVSSPNTPGLRDLQAVTALRPLLLAIQAAIGDSARAHDHQVVPLLVKIAPDLADADIDAIAKLVNELGLDGVVVANTTVSREGLKSTSALLASVGDGGLSGAPLRERSLAVLRRIRRTVTGDVVVISVGGVLDTADVWQRLVAGATLVQAYTGFVYGGPLWPRRVQRGLLRRLERTGIEDVEHIRRRS